MKSNYGPIGGEIALSWEAGRFVRIDLDVTDTLDQTARAQKAQRVFLSLLAWHNQKKLRVTVAELDICTSCF